MLPGPFFYAARVIDIFAAQLILARMFLWRWFKKLCGFALFCAVIYVASSYVNVHGKPARTYIDEFFASELWQEGKRDLLTWAAAILHFAGDKVEEGITAADMKQLDDLIDIDVDTQGIEDTLEKHGVEIKSNDLQKQIEALKLNTSND